MESLVFMNFLVRMSRMVPRTRNTITAVIIMGVVLIGACVIGTVMVSIFVS